MTGDVRQHQGPCDGHRGCVPFGICVTESSPLGCGPCQWRFLEGLVAKYLEEWLVVYCDDEVVAA